MKKLLFALAFLILLSAAGCRAQQKSPASDEAPQTATQPEKTISEEESPAEVPATEDARSPAAKRMAELTASDICETDWAVDREALAAALREASACETAQESDALTHYMLTIYLTDDYSSAAEHFFLTAGLDEPLVTISYRSPDGENHTAVFENETLYWLLRDIYRVEPEIDKTALTKYQDILDGAAQKIVSDSLTHAAATGFPGYTGFEIYILVKTDTFTDGADTYNVYSWDAAFLTDEPDKVPYAGGMRLDAAGRIVGLMENTVFAVKNPDSGSEDHRFLHWGIYQGETEEARTQNARAEILAAFQTPASE